MDIDRQTGELIDNYDSAVQAVEVILGTRLNSLVMLREFGGGVIELLGRLMTPALFGAFRTLIVASIDTWEPRFEVKRVDFHGEVDDVRLGRAEFSITVNWRPRGHLGDFTVASTNQLFVKPNQSGITVRAA